MALTDSVANAFGPGGALSRMEGQFRPRSAQAEMACAVAETLQNGGSLVVEAGTGVGKTFAYLVPALLSGERVIVSTATKALQDQLFGRDLPRLVKALNVPIRSALLKGRSSYVCLHRLRQARQSVIEPARPLLQALAQVEIWAQGTRSGDLAELPDIDERSPVIPWVTSTRENCLGSACPQFSDCHVQIARREALAADVVVINHHLFFADLAVRESGMAELLPSARVVIFDEAHQLNTTGAQFLGAQISTRQLLDYARDLAEVGMLHARGLQDWQTLASAIDLAARDLRMAAGGSEFQVRRTWLDRMPEGVEPMAWAQALQDLVGSLRSALGALDRASAAAPDFGRLHERGVDLLARLDGFAGECDPHAVRWVEAGMQLRLMESPLDIAPRMETLWCDPVQASSAWDEESEPAAPTDVNGRKRSWVFTSATLGDDATLQWFTEPCGLQSARTLRVNSPFAYERQATFFVPPDLPRPADPGHARQLAVWAADAVARLGGRTLILTTSLRALNIIGESLKARFVEGSSVEVLVQGHSGKRQIVERFRHAGAAAGRGASEGCVLVASVSFWEGLDVPGDALQMVIIDKLPFPPPGDPVIDARSRRLELQGRSAFKDFALPEAAVALKQGAGRLIRSETDTGVLVVADNRLLTMGYGKRLLKALPPMRRLQTQAEFDAAVDALKRGGEGGL